MARPVVWGVLGIVAASVAVLAVSCSDDEEPSGPPPPKDRAQFTSDYRQLCESRIPLAQAPPPAPAGPRPVVVFATEEITRADEVGRPPALTEVSDIHLPWAGAEVQAHEVQLVACFKRIGATTSAVTCSYRPPVGTVVVQESQFEYVLYEARTGAVVDSRPMVLGKPDNAVCPLNVALDEADLTARPELFSLPDKQLLTELIGPHRASGSVPG
ncbi:hypothetical protein [Amycolatopsis magusensis]|uniref:Lipoprotein n=1 Tax=Amycolatopsis magusensis TaxID=882444 RepID=A0ABS4PH50_9PSEU|nr:hypothetical protein [Amycolatopsis magusensis]MBP2178739.1 hypothetical protein [Amycolatopsis magusensis]